MSTVAPPPLRYLTADDVEAAMPSIDGQLALAERAMTALVADADLPPKIGVHPRPDGSFGHAMPAYLRGTDPDGADDLLGMKWVTGFGTANAARGWPAISAVVLLSDAGSGVPIAVLDGGPITARRTAAVSGVAIGRFAPVVTGRPTRTALIGAGVQGRSHLAVLARVVPGSHLTIHDRHEDRAAALADAARTTPGIGRATTVSSAREATADADVVVSAAAFTSPDRRQVMTNDWLTPDALVVPIDYATFVAAEVARDAELFLVDERGQFLVNRAAGQFDGYPDPDATLGEAILERRPRPPTGRVVVSHLGVGLVDVVFGDAILRRAVELGLGTVLPR